MATPIIERPRADSRPPEHFSWTHDYIPWPHHVGGHRRQGRPWYRNGRVIAAAALGVIAAIAVAVIVTLANSAPPPSTGTVTPPSATDSQTQDLSQYLNSLSAPDAAGNATYYLPGSSFTSMFGVTATPSASDSRAWDLGQYLNALITPSASGNATYYPAGSSFTALFGYLYPGMGAASPAPGA